MSLPPLHSNKEKTIVHTATNMAALEDIKQRLSQILSEAQAQGYNLDDVVPKEMQKQSPEKEELNAAREVIQEMKSREQTLEAANEALQTALREKEDELSCQPEDFVHLRIDLKQARGHIEYYKQLAEDAQRRADRYQQNLIRAEKEQLAASELAAKNEQLHREIAYHQSMIRKLQEENHRSAEIFMRLRAENEKAMAANEAKLEAMLSHASDVENESEAFSEAFETLIETLETENVTAASLLNGFLVLDRIEPCAHLGARARAGDIAGAQPVARRARHAAALGSDDLNCLAVLQRRI